MRRLSRRTALFTMLGVLLLLLIGWNIAQQRRLSRALMARDRGFTSADSTTTALWYARAVDSLPPTAPSAAEIRAELQAHLRFIPELLHRGPIATESQLGHRSPTLLERTARGVQFRNAETGQPLGPEIACTADAVYGWNGRDDRIGIAEGRSLRFIGGLDGAESAPALTIPEPARRIMPANDGETLLIIGESGRLHRLDRKSGATTANPLGGTITLVAQSDDARLSACIVDGQLQLAKLRDGSTIGPMIPITNDVTMLSFSPTGDLLAVITEDIALIDTSTGRIRQRLPLLNPIIGMVWIGEDRIATASGIGGIEIWMTTREERIWTIMPTSAPTAIAVSADQQMLAVGDEQGMVRLYDVHLGSPIAGVMMHPEPIRHVSLTHPRFHIIARGENGSSCWRWQPPLCFAHPARIVQTHTHRDSAWTLAADGKVRGYRISTPDRPVLIAPYEPIHRFALSQDGQRIATTTRDGIVRIWDSAGQELHAFFGRGMEVTDLAFIADDARLLLVTRAGLQVREVRDGQRVELDLPNPSNGVIALAPDRRSVLTGSGNGDVLLDSLAQPEARVRIASLGPSQVNALAWLDDGDRFIIASWHTVNDHERGHIDVFDRRGQRQMGTFELPGVVQHITSAGDELIVSVGNEVWRIDLRTSTMAMTPLTHPDRVLDMMIVEGGRALVVACAGVERHDTLWRWSLNTGQPDGPAWPHPGSVVQVRATSESLWTVGADAGLRYWPAFAPVDLPAKTIMPAIEHYTGARWSNDGNMEALSSEQWQRLRLATLRPRD